MHKTALPGQSSQSIPRLGPKIDSPFSKRQRGAVLFHCGLAPCLLLSQSRPAFLGEFPFGIGRGGLVALPPTTHFPSHQAQQDGLQQALSPAKCKVI